MMAVILALALLTMAFYGGCAGQGQVSEEERVIDFAIEEILVPKERENAFIVEWRRKSAGIGDVSPEELAQRFWKWEGGALTEINAEEYEELAAVRQGGNPNAWTYGQHAVTLIEMDEEAGEALVEIGSLYNPLSGSGIRYLLRKEDGEWTVVSEKTVWVS
jgi:hypothetical protein